MVALLQQNYTAGDFQLKRVERAGQNVLTVEDLAVGYGEKVLASEGYTSKQGCQNGIDSAKKNAPDDARYQRKTSANGKFYFNLTAGNNEIIGTSEMYESASGRDNGIDVVKRIAAGAAVEDMTV